MKKIIALVLCLVMIASFMAACSDGNELQVATTGNAVQETIDANAALSEIPKDLTLTIGMPLNGNIEGSASVFRLDHSFDDCLLQCLCGQTTCIFQNNHNLIGNFLLHYVRPPPHKIP